MEMDMNVKDVSSIINLGNWWKEKKEIRNCGRWIRNSGR